MYPLYLIFNIIPKYKSIIITIFTNQPYINNINITQYISCVSFSPNINKPSLITQEGMNNSFILYQLYTTSKD